MQQSSTSYRESLTSILAAAVAQGWALFGLHHAITIHAWPATNLAWLFALYAVIVLIPLTTQLLADQVKDSATWPMVGVMTVALVGQPRPCTAKRENPGVASRRWSSRRLRRRIGRAQHRLPMRWTFLPSRDLLRLRACMFS